MNILSGHAKYSRSGGELTVMEGASRDTADTPYLTDKCHPNHE